MDAALVSIGEIAPVAGTDFGFRQPCEVGEGHDHTLCLSLGRAALCRVATLTGKTGRIMVIEATEPALHLYDGRHLDHAGVALETRDWFDAVNHPHLPRPDPAPRSG